MKQPSSEEMWVFLISTVRYSLGRMTYMTSYAPELILKFHDYLADWQLEQIQSEVMSEIKLHDTLKKRDAKGDDYTGYLGHDCDYQSWVKFVADLGELLGERKKGDKDSQ
jgi:hypothetical protein